MVIFTSACFFFKVIRGKRVFTFEILDFAIFLFIGVTILGGVFSAGKSIEPAIIYACFAFAFFLFTAAVRSREMIVRAVGTITVSLVVVALIGLLQNYFSLAETTWQDTEMFEGITGRVVSTFENPNVLAMYILLVAPFTFALFFAAKKRLVKFSAIAAATISIACLIFTWSRGAWVGFIIAAAVFFAVFGGKIAALYAAALAAVPFLPFLLPANIIARFLSIGNVADSSTSYRVSIWQASMNMLRDFWVSGIGVGQPAYSAVYPEYSFAGIETAPHSHNLYMQIWIEYGAAGFVLFLLIVGLFAQLCFSAVRRCEDKMVKFTIWASVSGIAAFLAMGFTDYVWYNYRVCLMFWIVFAIGTAASRAAVRRVVS